MRGEMILQCPYCAEKDAEIEGLKAQLGLERTMRFPTSFVEALKVAQEGYDTWKMKNPKWAKRINGTPIENDLVVLISEAFVQRAREATR